MKLIWINYCNDYMINLIS